MADVIHGINTACAECCTALLKTGRGIDRHEFALLTAAYHSEGGPRVAGEPSPRQLAWKEVYGGKWSASRASRRLGFATRKDASATTIATAELAYECLIQHLRPASQAVVDRQAEVQAALLERVAAIGNCDFGDFFYDGDPTETVLQLIREIIIGRQRRDSATMPDHDLCGSGALVTYGAGRVPPTMGRLCELILRAGDWRLRTVAELKEKGLTRFISEYNGKSRSIKIDQKAARQLYAACTGMLSTTLNVNDAQAAQDKFEDAYGEALEIAAPELRRAVQEGALWLVGAEAELVEGRGRTVRAAGETLHWRDDGWVVEGRHRGLRIA